MNFARIWCITNPTPARLVTPPWTFTWQNLTPAEREGYPVWQTGLPAVAGHPTYHVNVIKLKWEIIWTGGLSHQSGLPHLPGVPHLHVNRPFDMKMPNFTFYGRREQATTIFSFFFWTWVWFLGVRLHLTKLMSWNNRTRDWKNANPLFKRRFRRRRPSVVS